MTPFIYNFALAQQISSGQGIWEWNLNPGILIGLFVWSLAYILLVRPIRRRQDWEPHLPWNRQAAFHLGTLILFIALVSPIDHLSDTFLLSAHMLQHLLLLLVVPPLWLIGMPTTWLDASVHPGWLRRALFWVTRPVPAFLIFTGMLYLWHIPSLYDAALSDENIHIVEHLTFLGAALIGWWPILGFLPKNAPRPAYPVQMMYIFLLMVFSTGLGAVISLAKDPLYPYYINAPHILNGTTVPAAAGGLRLWGLSVMDDQQAAGLIMWVPGNMIFFAVFMLSLYHWFSKEEAKGKAATSTTSQKAG